MVASMRGSTTYKVALEIVVVVVCLSVLTQCEDTEKPHPQMLQYKDSQLPKDSAMIDVNLDPWKQNIPQDEKLAHLRPPPPRIPETFDIFVGLSAFRDGHRCGYTLFTGFKRAAHPERLYFGVVDQIFATDLKCLDEYCKLAQAEWPEETCKYKDHVKIDVHDANQSRGPTLARHHQQKLVGEQEFCLQLDAHSEFTINWDVEIVKDWTNLDNEMGVLSTYLHDLNEGFVKPGGYNKAPMHLPHLCTTMRGGNLLVRNIGASLILYPQFPQLSALWGAGLSFSKCHAEKRVHIDSHTLWMFDGEEFLRASHLWTHGYDMYSPSRTGCVIYHNYTSVPARFEYVEADEKNRALETKMAENRFRLIVNMPFTGPVDTFDLDLYKFGTARTFSDYLKFSGVTFEENKTDNHTCKQLHWVPYTDPSSVETLLRGWKLNPSQAIAAPEVVASETLSTASEFSQVPSNLDTANDDVDQYLDFKLSPKFKKETAAVKAQELREVNSAVKSNLLANEKNKEPFYEMILLLLFGILVFLAMVYCNSSLGHRFNRMFIGKKSTK